MAFTSRSSVALSGTRAATIVSNRWWSASERVPRVESCRSTPLAWSIISDATLASFSLPASRRARSLWNAGRLTSDATSSRVRPTSPAPPAKSCCSTWETSWSTRRSVKPTSAAHIGVEAASSSCIMAARAFASEPRCESSSSPFARKRGPTARRSFSSFSLARSASLCAFRVFTSLCAAVIFPRAESQFVPPSCCCSKEMRACSALSAATPHDTTSATAASISLISAVSVARIASFSTDTADTAEATAASHSAASCLRSAAICSAASSAAISAPICTPASVASSVARCSAAWATAVETVIIFPGALLLAVFPSTLSSHPKHPKSPSP